MHENRDAFQRLASLFEAGRALAVAEQEILLARECDDPALRARLERMFSAARQRESLNLETRMHGEVLALHEPPSLELPERLDRFRILRVLGSGGMGTVFAAEEDEPRRLVALKVLRADVFSAEHGQRLEAEAAHLARLSHPGIARIYSAGRAQLGGQSVPWIATELVPGGNLLEHAEGAGLDDEARIRLLLEVLDAVAHAHQRGIIHRDLKPDNILVDEAGHPRVVDFGIARLEDEDATSLTRTGLLLGSLEAMSPEQAAGHHDEVDTRTDIYALGVVGYRLLARRTPHEIAELSLPQALRRIATEPAPTLGTVSARLRGDLSLIFAKAMAMEPGLRYPTVAAFAADLRRYLAGAAIQARPPSTLYRTRLLLRRHPVATSALALIIVGLLAFAALSTQQARTEHRLRQQSARIATAAQTRAAGIALADGDYVVAVQLLAGIQSDLAGWELDWLRASLEESAAGAEAAVVQVGSGSMADGRVVLQTNAMIAACDLQSLELEPLLDTSSLAGRVVALSAEAALIVQGEDTLCLVDLSTGKPAFEPLRVDGGIRSAAFIPGSQDVVAFGNTSLLRLAPRSGTIVWQNEAGFIRGLQVSVSPAGTLGILPARNVVRAFDLATGELRKHRLSGATPRVAWSPAGDGLAVVRSDGYVDLVDPASFELRTRLSIGASPVVSVAWREDGLLATAHADGLLRAWEPGSSRPIASWVSVAHMRDWREPVRGIRFDGGGAIVTASPGGLRRFRLDAPPRPRVLDDHAKVGGQFRWVTGLAVANGTDWFLTGGGDGRLVLRDLQSGTPRASLTDARPIRRVVLRPQGDLAVVTRYGGCTIVAVDQLRRVHQFDCPLGHRRPAFTPDGSELWLPCGEGRSPLLAHSPFDRGLEPAPAEDGLTAVLFLPGGGRVEGYHSGVCRLVRGDADIEVLTEADGDRVVHLAASPTGDHLVTCRGEGDVRLWDLRTGTQSFAYEAHGAVPVPGAAFSPDGTRVASCDRRGRILLWDVVGGHTVLSLAEHEDYVFDVAFTSDGRSLISVSGDGTVRLWQTD